MFIAKTNQQRKDRGWNYHYFWFWDNRERTSWVCRDLSYPVVQSEYESLNVFLASLGVEKYSSLFIEQEIDLDILKMMSESDLSENRHSQRTEIEDLTCRRRRGCFFQQLNCSWCTWCWRDAEMAAQLASRDAEMAAQLAALKKQFARNMASSSNSTTTEPSIIDGNECVMCLDGPRTIFVMPCKHLCLCKKCSLKKFCNELSCLFCSYGV